MVAKKVHPLYRKKLCVGDCMHIVLKHLCDPVVPPMGHGQGIEGLIVSKISESVGKYSAMDRVQGDR